MSEIIPFDFDGQPVRVVLDQESSEWFVARDVATVLGYKNINDAVNRHCKGVVKRDPLESTSSRGGTQEVNLIREPDVYRLIVGSRLPAAERFEAWLFEEVLPQLRRTGRYVLLEDAEEPEATLPENGRAQRLVDAGRVFGAVSRIITTAERLTPERLETALAVTGAVAGVNLKGLLERGGWQPPAALPRSEGEDWDARVTDWLQGQPDGGDWTTREVIRDALGYAEEEVGRSEEVRMGHCLRRLGLIAFRVRPGSDGRPGRRWRRRVH